MRLRFNERKIKYMKMVARKYRNRTQNITLGQYNLDNAKITMEMW